MSSDMLVLALALNPNSVLETRNTRQLKDYVLGIRLVYGGYFKDFLAYILGTP